jgi:hypothetical protein
VKLVITPEKVEIFKKTEGKELLGSYEFASHRPNTNYIATADIVCCYLGFFRLIFLISNEFIALILISFFFLVTSKFI